MSTSWRPTHLAAGVVAACISIAGCGGGGGDASPPPGQADTTPPTLVPPGAADTTPPTLVLTKNTSAASTAAPVTFTFTFSEDVGGTFTTDDIMVSGGTKGAFTKTSATVATLVVTPAANTTGMIEVSVAAGKYADLAGNANTVATSLSQAFNTVVAESGNTGTCTASPCIGFEGASVQFEGFEGLASAAVVNDPADATNKVAKLVKQASGQPWAGATIFTSGTAAKSVPAVGLATSKLITLRVYSPAVGEKIMLKIENSGNGAVNMEAQALTTRANAWETLTFNFATPTAGAYDPSATYDRISLFPGFMTQVDKTYYFDELKYSAAPAAPASLTFASNYAAAGDAWRSAQGGDAGIYIDTSVTTKFFWGGVAPTDATPNFYFGYGTDIAHKPWGFGAYVKAPNNGTATVSSYSNLRIAVWGNDQMITRRPTLTVILQAPPVGSCIPELKSTIATSGVTGVANYTLPLSGFTLQTGCGYTFAAQALAAGVTQVHVQVLGDNLQYSAGADSAGFYPNGLNIGPISFGN